MSETTRDAGMTGPDLDERLFETYFGSRPEEPVPRFSTDLSTAWILLQRLLEEHGWVEVVGTDGGDWICRVHDPDYSDLEWLGTVVAEARTAPLAICRAALKVAEGSGGSAEAEERAIA